VAVLGAWSNVKLRQAAERAEARSRQARSVVDDMYTKVAEEWLAEEPSRDQLRREFLEKALSLYQEFVQEGGTDPEVRRQAALAAFRVGQIHRTLDQGEKARESYAQAIALQEALVREYPDRASYKKDLASSHNWLGELLRESGRPLAEAEPHYRKALDLQQALFSQGGRDVGLQKDLARSHYNVAISQLDRGQFPGAETHLEEALSLLDQLRAQEPGPELTLESARCLINRGVLHKERHNFARARVDYEEAVRLLEDLKKQGRFRAVYRRDLAVTLHNLGNLFHETGDQARAAETLDRAAQTLRRLSEDFPDRPSYRKKLANTLNSLAANRAAAGDRAGAEKNWSESRSLLLDLTKEYSDVPDHYTYLGMTAGNLGWLHSEKKEWSAAAPLFEEAAARLREAQKLNPKNPQILRALRGQYRNLAETRLHLGDHVAASEAALAYPSVFGDQPQDFYYSACFLARAAALAGKDPTLSEPARAAELRRRANQAVSQLERASSLTGPPVQRLSNEGEVFRVLEGRPEFRKWLALLPGKNPG
jgi:tetratricopeptide (TPR) repeat protein